MDPGTNIGPVSSQEAQQTFKDQIARAVDAGATAIPLGDPIPERGWFAQPTILTGVTPDNPIFHEELFGPIPVLIKWSDDEEVIALANDSDYGLGGSVYSADVERARRLVLQIDAGTLSISMPSIAGVDMPFGGTKRSGYGKEMGPQGLFKFANTKLVVSPRL